MKSFETSFVGLFEGHDGGPLIERIEIPLVQRDYAQGRRTASVEEIRNDFLDALLSALNGGRPIGLDFVYGDVESGTLRPLDGQQRLTTLFLLHWYVAFRGGRLVDDQKWFGFAYATRASARLFCERLVKYSPPPQTGAPSSWIRDQSWFLHVWRHDPTIQSMLVMIDAIHQRFGAIDPITAWARLTDPETPAISFHVLPIAEIGSGDDLYIKMNSRGKPLTPFENFKARFEQTIAGSDRSAEFAQKIDGAWADVFWPLRGVDNIVDDEFMHYIEFITEVCEWRQGLIKFGRPGPRAEQMFRPGNKGATENLEFLFAAFDTWVGAGIDEAFMSVLTKDASEQTDKVLLFSSDDVRLFRRRCGTSGQRRSFGWPESLLLYAVLLHRIHGTGDFTRRLRVLRNLLEASTNELRASNMPALIGEVSRIVVDRTLDGVTTFNQAQVEDERLKSEFLDGHPSLQSDVFRLEDHRLLRGSLAAFDLDEAVFARRARVFERLMSNRGYWLKLTGALLATGEYGRARNARSFRFGSPENDRWWRELLTGTSRSTLTPTRDTLGRLLDDVGGTTENIEERLDAISQEWLKAQEAFDWRYYLVRYAAMREGKSGIYYSEGGVMGFSLCMLNVTQLNSWYHDPFLLAIWRESNVQAAAQNFLFMGYETIPRWLELTASDTKMRCVEAGIALQPPSDQDLLASFTDVCKRHGVDGNILRPGQVQRNGRSYDHQDRILMGAALLRDLVAAGL
jgi:hypothetical protein